MRIVDVNQIEQFSNVFPELTTTRVSHKTNLGTLIKHGFAQ
ncbi:hypothetical protein [Arsenophonus sp. PmNCSU2021_1]